jgi:hypothetical protein
MHVWLENGDEDEDEDEDGHGEGEGEGENDDEHKHGRSMLSEHMCMMFEASSCYMIQRDCYMSDAASCGPD